MIDSVAAAERQWRTKDAVTKDTAMARWYTNSVSSFENLWRYMSREGSVPVQLKLHVHTDRNPEDGEWHSTGLGPRRPPELAQMIVAHKGKYLLGVHVAYDENNPPDLTFDLDSGDMDWVQARQCDDDESKETKQQQQQCEVRTGIRSCGCGAKQICPVCWRILVVAARVIDRHVSQLVPKTGHLCRFSGKRGIHMTYNRTAEFVSREAREQVYRCIQALHLPRLAADDADEYYTWVRDTLYDQDDMDAVFAEDPPSVDLSSPQLRAVLRTLIPETAGVLCDGETGPALYQKLKGMLHSSDGDRRNMVLATLFFCVAPRLDKHVTPAVKRNFRCPLSVNGTTGLVALPFSLEEGPRRPIPFLSVLSNLTSSRECQLKREASRLLNSLCN